MSINKNWNRWIFASLSKHFNNVINTVNNLRFVVEGATEKSDMDHVDFRMTGPTWNQATSKEYVGDLTVNLLIRCIKDDRDFHKVFRMVGITESAFIPCIPVKKYGDGIDDNPAVMIGQLILKNNIQTTHFGQLAEDVPVLESTVESIYVINLEND